MRGLSWRGRLVIVAAVTAGLAAGIYAAIPWLRHRRRPPLTTIVAGGDGPPVLVLLHGYGSSAEHWMPFTRTIALPAPGRFVFPQAPEVTVPPDGPVDGRAWWRLDLGAHIPPGKRVPDLSAVRPPDLEPVAGRVHDLLWDLRRSPGGPIMLGGFSQGAMVAGEIAFRSAEPLAALVLLSGTTVDEASWEPGFAPRRGLPVFVAHGRTDPVLPFEVADRLRRKLEHAGLHVVWHPFAGAHEIPAEVVVALNHFLTSLP
jgi:phospholipase/carboxylesterase